jgi:hypothetical protein
MLGIIFILFFVLLIGFYIQLLVSSFDEPTVNAISLFRDWGMRWLIGRLDLAWETFGVVRFIWFIWLVLIFIFICFLVFIIIFFCIIALISFSFIRFFYFIPTIIVFFFDAKIIFVWRVRDEQPLWCSFFEWEIIWNFIFFLGFISVFGFIRVFYAILFIIIVFLAARGSFIRGDQNWCIRWIV